MAARRRPQKMRFRSHRGTRSRGGSVFRAHHGHRKGGAVFRAHSARGLAVHKAKAVRAMKAAKLAPYKAVGVKRNPYAKLKAKPYKPVGHQMPKAWAKPGKHPARYRAAKAKRV